MSAARRKKIQQSLYNSFYGKWSDEIIDIEKQVEEYAQRIENLLEQGRKKKSDAPTSPTMKYKSDIDRLRENIRNGAIVKDKSGLYDVNTRKTTNLTQQKIPVIDEVVRVKNIPQFTNETHRIEVSLGSTDYYSEQITTKIVGMEETEWWEYVLIYGFFKSFKIAREYSQLKEYIDKGIQSSRIVSGQNLHIKFIPKKKDDVDQVKDIVNGQQVIRETGITYEGTTLALEVPQKPLTKKQEYQKGYFVYEDTFSTLVIDFDALNEHIEKMLLDCEVNLVLIEEIKKIVNYGRLSTI